MNITPLDVQQQEFRKTLFGLDANEVKSFLDLVGATIESLHMEINKMKDDRSRLEAELTELKAREGTLRDTLLTAQKLSEETRKSAKKEAEVVISQAELQAEKILHNAQARLMQILDDINEAKRQKVQFISKVHSIVDSHLKLLDIMDEPNQKNPSLEENLKVLQINHDSPANHHKSLKSKNGKQD